MKSIHVARPVADGEHCVALLDIDTVFGTIAFAGHVHIVYGQIAFIRGHYDPRPIIEGAKP